MASLNKVMLIGNAGKDADLRYTANGLAQARFSIAVNNRRRGQSGEWEDQTEWFNIVIFGDMAERVSQYITKGKPVFVEGRIQTRTWDDQEGQKRTSIDVIASGIQLLGGRDQDGGSGGGGGGGGWNDAPDRGPRGGGGSDRGARGGFGGGGQSRGGGNSQPVDDIDDLPFE